VGKDKLTFYGGVRGEELTQDDSRSGFVDDGNIAWPERIVEARRQWPELPAADFEKEGRRWVDKASGVQYRAASGAPLLSVGSDAVRNIIGFLQAGGKLVFLERIDVPDVTTIYHGPIRGGVVENGVVRWTT
jgi:hypothetical protein